MTFEDVLVGGLTCGLVTILLVGSTEAFQHWFVLPLLVLGTFCVAAARPWISGSLPFFSPHGFVSTFGIYFFFVAPLLHVLLDHWMWHPAPPDDWRPWLGWMAMLNITGVLGYYAGVRLVARLGGGSERRSAWALGGRRLAVILPLFLLTAAFLQAWLYARLGGVGGYLEAFATQFTTSSDAFVGTGRVSMVAESFPILTVIGYSFMSGRLRTLRCWPAILLLIAVLGALAFGFGGLRGSRAAVVWSMVWALGIVHLKVRPLSRVTLTVGVVAGMLFMYGYGFYKTLGAEAFTTWRHGTSLSQLETDTRRSVDSLLLGDLARSDVQAFVLHRLVSADSDYDYALGRTYVGALALFVPHALWETRPPGKVREGTDAQYGAGAYDAGFTSSRIYGLAAETMLNFGPFAVPIAFVLYGLAVGLLDRVHARLHPADSRVLLTPLLTIACCLLLASDIDNVIVLLVKYGAIAGLVVWLASARVRISHAVPQ